MKKRLFGTLSALLLTSALAGTAHADVVTTTSLQVKVVKVYTKNISGSVVPFLSVQLNQELSGCYSSSGTGRKRAYVLLDGAEEKAALVQSLATAALLSGKLVDVDIEDEQPQNPSTDAETFLETRCELVSIRILD